MTGTLLAILVAAAVGLVAGWALARRRGNAGPATESARAAELRRLERAQAVAEERERIYGDLHDDIGAKLLNLIYAAERPGQADLARSILQDLRDVVSRSRGTPGSLLEVLADIRGESEQRLAALGVDLAWEQEETLPDPALDHGHALHLFRIVREALTNALRHAQPERIRIRVRSDVANGAPAKRLLLDVTDDGAGIASGRLGAGRGTSGMQERAAELQGSIAWEAGTAGGTKVVLQVPLP